MKATRNIIPLLILNLTAGISCLIISLNILIYGPVKIVEPNPYIVLTEVTLALATIALNVRAFLSSIMRARRGIYS